MHLLYLCDYYICQSQACSQQFELPRSLQHSPCSAVPECLRKSLFSTGVPVVDSKMWTNPCSAHCDQQQMCSVVQYAMAGIGVPHARADKQILPIERLRDRMSRLQALLAHSDKGGHGTKLGRRQVGLRAILPCCLTHRHLTLSRSCSSSRVLALAHALGYAPPHGCRHAPYVDQTTDRAGTHADSVQNET